MEKRLGEYCSYCEFPIKHVPEVEHIASKVNGGDRTDWKNLLLGCKYCNTRKSRATSPESVDEYIWPDCDNTALAYTYQNGVPEVNKKKLLEADSTGKFYKKAKKLFDLVQLNHVPDKKEKDKRFAKRNEAFQIAQESLDNWRTIKKIVNDSRVLELYKNTIATTALAVGFFSVWMTVFSEESEILCMLIERFPNTRKEYFDKAGHPVSLYKQYIGEIQMNFPHPESPLVALAFLEWACYYFNDTRVCPGRPERTKRRIPQGVGRK